MKKIGIIIINVLIMIAILAFVAVYTVFESRDTLQATPAFA